MIASRTIKNNVKELVNIMWRPVPINWLMRMERATRSRWLKLITRAGLLNRSGVICDGIGKGLRINVGYSNPDYLLGINERPLQTLLHRTLHTGAVFYDIGANVGFFSLIASRLVGECGRVYAFEPEPKNISLIYRNIRLNQSDNISVIEAAVSQESGVSRLYIAEYAGGHSLYQDDHPFPGTEVTIPVPTVSLDGLVDSKKILPPSMVKIDVEGGEVEVLKGMNRILIQHRPVVIYELDDRRNDRLLAKKTEIASFLTQFDYDTEDLACSYMSGDWLVSHTLARPREHVMR